MIKIFLKLICFIIGHDWDWYEEYVGFMEPPEDIAYCRRCDEEETNITIPVILWDIIDWIYWEVYK